MDLPWGELLCRWCLFSMLILSPFWFICSTPLAHPEGRVPVRKAHLVDLLIFGPSTLALWPLTQRRPYCSLAILTIHPAANTPATPSSMLGLEGQPSRTENWATMRDHRPLFPSSPPWTKSESRMHPNLMVIILSVIHLQSCRRGLTTLMAAKAQLHSVQREKQHKEQHSGLKPELLNPQRPHPNLKETPPKCF